MARNIWIYLFIYVSQWWHVNAGARICLSCGLSYNPPHPPPPPSYLLRYQQNKTAHEMSVKLAWHNCTHIVHCPIFSPRLVACLSHIPVWHVSVSCPLHHPWRQHACWTLSPSWPRWSNSIICAVSPCTIGSCNATIETDFLDCHNVRLRGWKWD